MDERGARHQRVAVTGANGFVGKVVVEALREAGISCTPLVRRPTSSIVGAQLADYASVDDLADLFANATAIVHLIGRAHVLQEDQQDPLAAYRAVNVDVTRRVGAAAVRAGVRRIVYISSVKVHGESSRVPFSATDEPRPQDPYGMSKLEAEQELRKLESGGAIEVCVIRPPLVYGPGVKGNLERLIKWIRAGVPIPFGAVDNRRSLVSVANLADLIRCCIGDARAAGASLMVSDGEDVSTAELVTRLACAMNTRARLWRVPKPVLAALFTAVGRSGEYRRLCGSLQVDITATRELLGWHPPVSLSSGLARMFGQ